VRKQLQEGHVSVRRDLARRGEESTGIEAQGRLEKAIGAWKDLETDGFAMTKMSMEMQVAPQMKIGIALRIQQSNRIQREQANICVGDSPCSAQPSSSNQLLLKNSTIPGLLRT